MTISITTGLSVKADHRADVPRLCSLATILGKQREVVSVLKELTVLGHQAGVQSLLQGWVHGVWAGGLCPRKATLYWPLQGCFPSSWKTVTIRATSVGPIQTLIFIRGGTSSPVGTDADINPGLCSDLQKVLERPRVSKQTWMEPGS